MNAEDYPRLHARAKSIAKAAGVGIDPLTILTILLTLFKLLASCAKPLSEDAKLKALQRPSIRMRRKLAALCKERFSDKKEAGRVYDACLSAGAQMKALDVERCGREASNS